MDLTWGPGLRHFEDPVRITLTKNALGASISMRIVITCAGFLLWLMPAFAHAEEPAALVRDAEMAPLPVRARTGRLPRVFRRGVRGDLSPRIEH